MSAVLGMAFRPQIIIAGWSTVALVSPTPYKKQYRGQVHTCLQCLALFFVLKSLLTDAPHSACCAPKPPTKQYLGPVCTAWHGFLYLGDPHTHAQSTHSCSPSIILHTWNAGGK